MTPNCFNATEKGRALREELQKSVDRKLRKLAKNTDVPEGMKVRLAMIEATAEAKSAKMLKDRRDYLRYSAIQSAIERLDSVAQDDQKALTEAALSIWRPGSSRHFNDISSNARQIIAENNQMLGTMASIRGRFFRLGVGLDKKWNDDIFKEAFGINTGNKDAKQIAKEMKAALDALNKKARAAGADIPEIDGWFLPQRYDHTRIAKLTADDFANELMRQTPEGVSIIDRSKFVHPETGAQLMEEDIRELLKAAHETIATQGLNKWDQPGGSGVGSLMNKRAMNRSIHYTPEGWLHVSKKYGTQDIVAAFLSYRDNFASDISVMQLLGPNPDYAKDAIVASVGKRLGTKAKADKIKADIEHYHNITLGRGNAIVSDRVYKIDQIIRKSTTGMLLNNTIVSALSDFKTQVMKAIVTDTSVFRTLQAFVEHMWNTEDGARAAIEYGIVVDTLLSGTHASMRFIDDPLDAANGWLDTSVNAIMEKQGLTAFTNAGKLAAADVSAMRIADDLGTAWDKLSPVRKAYYEDIGIDAFEWDTIITKTKPAQRNGLIAADIVDISAVRALAPNVAAKLQRRLIWDTELAVVSPDIRTKAFFARVPTRKGTVPDLLYGQLKQFKTFLAGSYLNVWDMTIGNKRLPVSTRVKAGLAFLGFGALFGALIMQVRQYQAGKDPLPMDDPRFWITAMVSGGSLPVLGDVVAPYIFGVDSAYQETGQEKGLADLMPAAGIAKKSLSPFFDSVIDGFKGDFDKAIENLGEGAIETMKNASALVGARHVALRPILDHYLWGPLEDTLAPHEYEKKRKAQIKFTRQMGSDYWWRPGATSPTRSPF